MTRIACLTIALVALCTGAAAYAMAAWMPRPETNAAGDLQALAFKPRPGAPIPLDTVFADEAGRAVTLRDYFGKTPVIVVLDYLRCTSLCGVTLHNIFAALDRLPLVPGRDYQVVAISIDPRDKPTDAAAARAKYAGLLRQSGNGLHFLTGPAPAARAVAGAVGFPYRYDRLLDAYVHPAGFVIAAPGGTVSRYIEGVAVTPHEFIRAFADAQQNKAPGLLARIVLLCHVQGAPLGRFTVPVLAAFMAADIAAGLAAIAVFTTIRRRGG